MTGEFTNSKPMDKSIVIEKRQYIKRVTIGVTISICSYILLLILMVFVSNFKQKEDQLPVMSVRLPDKIFEEIKNMDEKQRKKFIKKQRKIIKKKKEKVQKKIKENKQSITQNNFQTDNNKTDNQSNANNTTKVKESETTQNTVPITNSKNESDLWSDYTNKEEQNQNKIESDFFNDNKNNSEASSEEDSYINELDNLDNTLKELEGDIDNNLSNTTEDNTNNNSQENGISWTTGRKRKLIDDPPFDIPEKFAKTGQKYSIKLKFTVLESGLVQKVDVLESTGYPELDAYIAAKFKLKRFERADGVELSEGEIKINIGY